MRMAVTGASGNIGVRLVERLLAEAAVTEVVAQAGRHTGSTRSGSRVQWRAVDIGDGDAPQPLARALAGVDAVVHRPG